jgi:hypothetical protein
MRSMMALAIILAVGVPCSFSQDDHAEMAPMQRTVDHERLAFLAGNWKITGSTTKDCPYGAAKFTATEHSELMSGGLYLVSKTQYRGQFHNSSQIAVFGVDPSTKKYTYDLYNSMGTRLQATGALQMASEARARSGKVGKGDTFTWDSGAKMAAKGQPVATQYVVEVVSPTRYNFKVVGGGIVWMTGVADKVSNPAPE